MSELFLGFGLSRGAASYLLGVLGSFAIEVAALVRDLGANGGVWPTHYRKGIYPIVRVVFAFIAAGPAAVMLSSGNDWTAFYIGISAPLIFDRVAAGIKPNGVE